MKITFTNDAHACTSYRDGDWIVWRCPICAGYERRYNPNTGQMAVKGKTDFAHQGSNAGGSEMGALVENLSQN